MQNKPYFFFGNRGSQKGGSDTWENSQKIPFFLGVASIISSGWLGRMHSFYSLPDDYPSIASILMMIDFEFQERKSHLLPYMPFLQRPK